MGDLEPPVEPSPIPEPGPEETFSEGMAGGPAESGAYPSNPPPPRARRGPILAIVAVAVAVVVVLAILLAAGIGPFARPGGASGSATALSYSQAETQAAAAANGVGGGPWSVLLASGVDFTSSFDLNTSLPSASSLGLSSGCTTTHVPGSASFVNIPADTSGPSTGTSPSWIFLLTSSSGLLFVSVVRGQAEVWGELTGGACALAGLIGTLPTVTADSPKAVAAAMGDGGSAFISAHPGGNLSFSVVATSSAWSVNYTNCPDFTTASPRVAYYAFAAEVSIATGAVVGTPFSGSTTCSGLGVFGGLTGSSGGHGTPLGPPLGTALALASPATAGAGNVFVVDVTTAAHGVSLSDLTFELLGPSGQRLADPLAEIDLDAASGCVLLTGFLNLSYYSGLLFGNGLQGAAQCPSGTAGGNGTLLDGEKLLLDGSKLTSQGTSAQGDTFEALATSTFSGGVNVSLPTGPSLVGSIVVNSTAYVNSTGAWIVNVTGAPTGLSIGDLGFRLVDGLGANVSAPLAMVTLLEASGCTLSVGSLNSTYYSGSFSGTQCAGTTGGGAEPVTAGDRIVLATGLAGHGATDTLEILGWFGFSGTVRVAA